MNMTPKLASIIEGLRGQENHDWADEIQNLWEKYDGALEKVQELDAENTKLKQRDNYVLDESSGWWRVDESGERIEGPFCPTCYSTINKYIRLYNSAYEEKVCLVCRNYFPVRTLRPFLYGE